MSSIALGTKGFIYCVRCASHEADVYKVGCTSTDVFERARQLTASTSSPTPFHVVHHRATSDANAAEARCHDLLDEYRLNDGREFFRAPLGVIIRIMDEVTGNVPKPIATPWADLFGSFPDDGSDRELTEAEQTQCRELASRLADSSAGGAGRMAASAR
jgi:hypothetical protein